MTIHVTRNPHEQEATWNACVWCIDGFTPMGIHPELGAVYRMCPTDTWCGVCGDLSLFPADFMPHDDRVQAMATLGLEPVWCPNCLGILHVVPATNGGGIQ